MEITQELEFSHEDRRRIYEHIESHGTVKGKEAARTLHIDPSGFRHHVAILKRDGLVEETEDDRLRVAFDEGAEEEFESDGVEFNIRQARQEDLAGLVGVIRQVAGGKTYIVAENVADVVDHEEVLLRHNDLETRMFFVATVNDEVVGWLHLRMPEVEKLEHTAELTVGVLEEYQGHGIGSHLLDRGTAWAASNGFEKLYNSVPSTNEEAIVFLEEHGWETEATRAKHYKIDGEYIDEVMMATVL